MCPECSTKLSLLEGSIVSVEKGKVYEEVLCPICGKVVVIVFDLKFVKVQFTDNNFNL